MPNTKKSTLKSTQDPRQNGPKPPFKEHLQELPGNEYAMDLKPDHGEDSYVGSGRLEGKVAIVTGADSGIGRAVALAFAREGADVLISYLSEDQDAQESARAVEAAGRKAILVRGDIGSEKHCQKIVERALKEWGKLDILVNNAACQISYEGGIDSILSQDFDRVFKTNVYGMFYLCKAALPRMEKGGSIINTSSIQAFQPDGPLLPYATTKGAIVTFTKALAQMAIKQGVRVNAVAPGPVWTPLNPASAPKKKVESFGKDTLLERPAQPVELAPLFVFLASPEASYVTAEVLGATGGMMPV